MSEFQTNSVRLSYEKRLFELDARTASRSCRPRCRGRPNVEANPRRSAEVIRLFLRALRRKAFPVGLDVRNRDALAGANRSCRNARLNLLRSRSLLLQYQISPFSRKAPINRA